MKKYILLVFFLPLLSWTLEVSSNESVNITDPSHTNYIKDILKKFKIDEKKVIVQAFTESGCSEWTGKSHSFTISPKEPIKLLSNVLETGSEILFCGSKINYINLKDGELIKISGISCQGDVEFHEGQLLCRCTIGADSIFQGVKLVEGGLISLTKKGEINAYNPMKTYVDKGTGFKFEQGKWYQIKDKKPVGHKIDPNSESTGEQCH